MYIVLVSKHCIFSVLIPSLQKIYRCLPQRNVLYSWMIKEKYITSMCKVDLVAKQHGTEGSYHEGMQIKLLTF
jgi:hypothetical protein